MTGLNPFKDTILSISCILTTSDLAPLDSAGFNAVISHTQEQLSQMSDWCIQTHGRSGLTQECLSSSTSAEEASSQLLSYIKHYIPEPRRALLAGNSIHADRGFLLVPPWDRILEHLHYRLFDVSAMKEMVRRWASEQVLMAAPRKELRHTAREDVLESIQEAQYYKTLIESMAPMPPNTKFADSSRLATRGNNLGAMGVPPMALSAISMPIVPQPAIPGPIRRPTQEDLNFLQHNGSNGGDVNGHDQGYRTDIP
jgi:oligoribonuclease